MSRSRGVMSWSLFKKIVNDFKVLDDETRIFYLLKEGEPLMDPGLFKKIDYLKKNLENSYAIIHTNASLLTISNAKRLLNSRLDEVSFSVDGASSRTYERMRTGLNYETVYRNIINFFELRERSDSGLRTVMQMIVNEENKHEMAEYRRLWSAKADRIFFKAMHSYLDANNSMSPNGLSKKQLRACNDPFFRMVIYHNGDVGVCCWDYDNVYKVGDIREKTVLEVYNNERYKKMRDAQRNLDCKNISPCNRCARIYGGEYIGEYRRYRTCRMIWESLARTIKRIRRCFV